MRENRVPRIREIGSLQVLTGYLTFSLKKTVIFKISLKMKDVKENYVQRTDWDSNCECLKRTKKLKINK